jgi:hypothetical protein
MTRSQEGAPEKLGHLALCGPGGTGCGQYSLLLPFTGQKLESGLLGWMPCSYGPGECPTQGSGEKVVCPSDWGKGLLQWEGARQGSWTCNLASILHPTWLYPSCRTFMQVSVSNCVSRTKGPDVHTGCMV